MVAAPRKVVDERVHRRRAAAPDDAHGVGRNDSAARLAAGVVRRAVAGAVADAQGVVIPAAGVGVNFIVGRGRRGGVGRADREHLEHGVGEVEEALQLLVAAGGGAGVDGVAVGLADDDGGRPRDGLRRVAVLRDELLDVNLARRRRAVSGFAGGGDVDVVAPRLVVGGGRARDDDVEEEVRALAGGERVCGDGAEAAEVDEGVRTVPDERPRDVADGRPARVAHEHADEERVRPRVHVVAVQPDHVPG